MQLNPTIELQDSGPAVYPPRAGVTAAIGVAVAAIAIQLFPAFGEMLQWQRGDTLLTYLTGHLTHWSWNHLAWDLAAFAPLAFAAIRIIPQRFLLCLLISGIVIPLEIALNQPQFDTYRGLSGIDSALFGLIIAGLWKLRRTARWIAGTAMIAFLGKTIYELAIGDTLFVEQAQEAFIPATSAHISGCLAGLASGFPINPMRRILRFPLPPGTEAKR